MTSNLDYSKPNAARNHHEVLRCYDVLVQHHADKLVKGLIVRMGSVEEQIRLAALTIFKHLVTSSFAHVEDRMPEIFQAVHGKLQADAATTTPRVQGLLAQLTALLGHKGFLQGREGRDFVDFVVQRCASRDQISSSRTVRRAPSRCAPASCNCSPRASCRWSSCCGRTCSTT